MTVQVPAAQRDAMHVFAMPQPTPDPGDIPGLIDSINRNMQSMREEQGKIEEDLAKKGAADVILSEKVDRLNNQITLDMDTLKKAQDEQGRRMAAMIAGGGGSRGGEQELNHARRFIATATGKRLSRNAEVDLEAYRNYRDAFEQTVCNNLVIDHLESSVRAAMTIGTGSEGGYLVPNEISTEIERRIHDSSPMRQVARVITISKNAWEAPWKTSKGTSGGWVSELQARNRTDTPTVGMQEIKVHGQYAFPEASEDMLEDAALDVEAMIIQDTEDEMSRVENTAFVIGNGKDRAKGFLTYKDTAETTEDKDRDWGKLQYLPLGAAAGFPQLPSGADDGAKIIDLITALHPTYRQGAVFTMNRKSEATIRKLRDADGRYLVGFGDIRDGTSGFLVHGYPIVNFEDMPDIASDSFPIAFGNFNRGYYIIDRRGFRVLIDPFTHKPFVGWYITKRVGGDVRNFDAIKLLKVATT